MGDYGQYDVPTVDTMVNFKVGQPAPSLLPLDMIRKAGTAKLSETDPLFLQYGDIPGFKKWRQTLAGFLNEQYNPSSFGGREIQPDELFTSNGVTGALALACGLFCSVGDLVFCGEPTYFLALQIFKDFKLNVKQIPMDEDGMNMDKLEETLKTVGVPKFLYVVPTCHNPTGRTLSTEKRQRLAQLAKEYGFIIMADEVYQMLSFPHVQPPPPMYHFDDPENGNIMSFGSFSKIAAPALRLGWIHAPKRLLKVIFESGQLDSSGGVNPVISGIMQAAINSGDESANLVKVRKILWDRADALMKALDQHLPEGVSYEKPDGGYFVLVRLPTGYKAVDLLPIAAKHKVAFLPGKSFGSRMQNYLRLSFSYYDVQDQVVGAERLGAAIREFLSQGPPSSSSSSSSSSDIKVAVHGATGRLGTLIVKQLMEEDSQGMYAGAVTRDGQVPADASVVIDVTRPEGTASLLKRLADRQNPPAVIVGTTGDLPNAEMEAYAAKAPVVVVPNFSVGIPLLTNLAKAAAKSLPSTWNIELTETHHTKKVDAPSGTAKKIAAAIESTESAALAGAAVPCHALRLGDVFGDHTVHLAGPGERIELTHKATRREVFAIGAVRVAKEYARKGPGLVWL